MVRELRDRDIEARFQDSAQLSTTVGMVAAGHGITLSAPPWLEGVPGIVWRPLTDVRIEIRAAAAWRAANRSPLLRVLVDLLPVAAEAGASSPGDDSWQETAPDHDLRLQAAREQDQSGGVA